MYRQARAAIAAATLMAGGGMLSAQQPAQHTQAAVTPAGSWVAAGSPIADGWIRGGRAPAFGTLEVGGFGQYTRFDGNAGCPCDRPLNAFGYGGRVGLFLGPAAELEVDVGTAQAERAIVGGRIRYTAVAARLNYNLWGLPFGPRSSLLAGVGAVRSSYSPDTTTRFVPEHHHRAEWGASGLAGARLALSERVAVRIDGVADYMPGPENLNLTGRAGLSLLLGRLLDRRDVGPIASAPLPPARPTPQPRDPEPPARPAPRDENLTICVIDPAVAGGMRHAAALRPENTGDTLTMRGSERVPLRSTLARVPVAQDQDWFMAGRPLLVRADRRELRFLAFGHAGARTPTELQLIGMLDNMPVYAERSALGTASQRLEQLNTGTPANLGILMQQHADVRDVVGTLRTLHVPAQIVGCVFQPLQLQEDVRKSGE